MGLFTGDTRWFGNKSPIATHFALLAAQYQVCGTSVLGRVSRTAGPEDPKSKALIRKIVRRRDNWNGGIGFVTEDLALVG